MAMDGGGSSSPMDEAVHRAGEPWELAVERLKSRSELPWNEPTYEEQNAEADYLIGREMFVQGIGQGTVQSVVKNRLGASGHVVDFVSRGTMEVTLARKGNAGTLWLVLPNGALERARKSRKGKMETYDRMLYEQKLARESAESQQQRLMMEGSAARAREQEQEAAQRREKLVQLWRERMPGGSPGSNTPKRAGSGAAHHHHHLHATPAMHSESVWPSAGLPAWAPRPTFLGIDEQRLGISPSILGPVVQCGCSAPTRRCCRAR
jgi:hypothetical protein